jgi:hypothetical protein
MRESLVKVSALDEISTFPAILAETPTDKSLVKNNDVRVGAFDQKL